MRVSGQLVSKQAKLQQAVQRTENSHSVPHKMEKTTCISVDDSNKANSNNNIDIHNHDHDDDDDDDGGNDGDVDASGPSKGNH